MHENPEPDPVEPRRQVVILPVVGRDQFVAYRREVAARGGHTAPNWHAAVRDLMAWADLMVEVGYVVHLADFGEVMRFVDWADATGRSLTSPATMLAWGRTCDNVTRYRGVVSGIVRPPSLTRRAVPGAADRLIATVFTPLAGTRPPGTCSLHVTVYDQDPSARWAEVPFRCFPDGSFTGDRRALATLRRILDDRAAVTTGRVVLVGQDHRIGRFVAWDDTDPAVGHLTAGDASALARVVARDARERSGLGAGTYDLLVAGYRLAACHATAADANAMTAADGFVAAADRLRPFPPSAPSDRATDDVGADGDLVLGTSAARQPDTAPGHRPGPVRDERVPPEPLPSGRGARTGAAGAAAVGSEETSPTTPTNPGAPRFAVREPQRRVRGPAGPGPLTRP